METQWSLAVIGVLIMGLVCVGALFFICLGLSDVFRFEICHWFLGLVVGILKWVQGLFGS